MTMTDKVSPLIDCRPLDVCDVCGRPDGRVFILHGCTYTVRIPEGATRCDRCARVGAGGWR